LAAWRADLLLLLLPCLLRLSRLRFEPRRGLGGSFGFSGFVGGCSADEAGCWEVDRGGMSTVFFSVAAVISEPGREGVSTSCAKHGSDDEAHAQEGSKVKRYLLQAEQ